ncbi:hypothetical protein FRC03_001225 [Tulasnella sp. 419]|nr:hypothetical protein FRC03_001225 [Tulasnella sp. 419]
METRKIGLFLSTLALSSFVTGLRTCVCYTLLMKRSATNCRIGRPSGSWKNKNCRLLGSPPCLHVSGFWMIIEDSQSSLIHQAVQYFLDFSGGWGQHRSVRYRDVPIQATTGPLKSLAHSLAASTAIPASNLIVELCWHDDNYVPSWHGLDPLPCVVSVGNGGLWSQEYNTSIAV